MQKKQILWADDEIDLLQPHIMFLQSKGYDVDTVTNGDDAIAKVSEKNYDIILLDEMMTGKDGLETLQQILLTLLYQGLEISLLVTKDKFSLQH